MKRNYFILPIALALVLTMNACCTSFSSEVEPPNNVSVGTEETLGLVPVTQATETAAEAAVSETVLVDEAGVKITAKKLELGGLFGPELKLLIENESGKDLTVQTRNSSVNGYMVETLLSADVVSGKKANDGIIFSDSALDACGITTIADMEFSFHIFTTEDWETYLDTDVIRVETTAADTYTYTYDDSGEPVHDKDGVKIVVKGLSEKDSFFGPGIIVYAANTSDKTITIQVRDVSVNGFMIDPIYSCDVAPGKHAVDAITFLDTALEENEIEAISQVELSFHVADADDWDSLFDTQTVYINFE